MTTESEDDSSDTEKWRQKLTANENTLKGKYDNFLNRIGQALIIDDLDEDGKEGLKKWLDHSNTEKEREYLQKLINSLERPDEDPLSGSHGVLLRDQIHFYVEEYSLLDPFEEDNLKPASYSLRVGDQYSVEGENNRLVENDSFKIPPFQVAVIKTKERVNMPHFLIGRWNIRVGHAYSGLLWVGGPQVDPGYSGYLSCPIYNLSDEPVRLSHGDKLARMDFVKTTEYNEHGYPQENLDWNSGEYNCKKGDLEKPEKYDMSDQEKIVFEDYNPDQLKSALFSEVQGEIEELEGEVNRLGRVVRLSFGAIATILAVLFTTLSLLFTQGDSFSADLSLIQTGMFVGGVSLAVLATVAILALVFAVIMKVIE